MADAELKQKIREIVEEEEEVNYTKRMGTHAHYNIHGTCCEDLMLDCLPH